MTEIPIATDVALHDGDKIRLGDTTLEVAWLTGHRASYLEHVSTSAALIYRDPDGSAHVFAGTVYSQAESATRATTLPPSPSCSMTSRRSSSRPCPTRPRSIPVMVPTRRWAQRPSLAEWSNRSW